jgi:outer membrane receptor protein involved in Fe transport
MVGSPAVSAELPSASATWMPDDPTVHAPSASFSTPHRPPIA